MPSSVRLLLLLCIPLCACTSGANYWIHHNVKQADVAQRLGSDTDRCIIAANERAGQERTSQERASQPEDGTPAHDAAFEQCMFDQGWTLIGRK